jgi:Fibronectin type III domain
MIRKTLLTLVFCGLSVGFSTLYAVEAVVVDALTRHVLNTGVVNFNPSQLQVNGVNVVGGGGGGGGGGGVTSITLSFPGIFISPVSFSNDGADNWSASAIFSSQPAFTFFGNGTGSTDEPTFMDAATAKVALSLNNVDNTSDANKPISTAQASANTAMQGNIASNTSAIGTINTTLGALTLDTVAAPTADVSIAGFKITNLADPTSASDAANKSYVDTAANVGPPHPAVLTASTANLTLSGEQTIDGIATSASRVLVKNQSTASQNGIYVTAAGAWSRATDADTGTEVSGSVFVSSGTTQTATSWGVTTPQPITINTTAIAYTLTGTGGTTYSAGSGLALTANTFSLATMGARTVKGNSTGSTAVPTNISVSDTGLSFMALGNPGIIAFPRINADNSVSTLSDTGFRSAIGAGTVTTLTRVNNVTDLLSISIATPGTTPEITFDKPNASALTFYGNSSGSAAAPTFMSAATARTTLGGTTVGQNLFTLTNPGAQTYPRINNDNTVTAISATTLRTDISAGQVDSQVTLANNGTSAAPATWTTGATAVIETVALNSIDRVITMPPALSYPAGRRIIYTDNVTTGNFGRSFRRNGTNTLNGGTADFRPFIGGATGVYGGKSVEFENVNQTGWQVVSTASTITAFQDPSDATQKVIVDVSNQPSGQTPPWKFAPSNIGDSVSVVPTNAGTEGVLTNINSSGSVSKGPISPTNLSPNVFTIGTKDNTIASGTTVNVTNTCSLGTCIDTVWIAGNLAGTLTITLPDAGLYKPANFIKVVDFSGSVSTSHPVTVTSTNGTDTFNYGPLSVTFDEANGTRFYSSDGTSNWSVPSQKATVNQGFQILSTSGGNVTLNPDPTVSGAQKAYISLGNGVNNLLIPSPFDGMQVLLMLVQPGSGAAGTINLPIDSATSGGGAGLVTLTATNGATDQLKGVYVGGSGVWEWEQPILNFTTATLPAAPSALSAVVGSPASTAINLSWTDNSTNETGFEVFRSVTNNTSYGTSPITTRGVGVTTYTNTGLTPGTLYYYKVRSVNTGGQSSFATEASATTTAACSSLGDSFLPVSTSGSTFGTGTTQWLATKFTATAGNTAICRIDVALFYTGASRDGNVTAYIYADNAGVPALAPAGIVATSTNSPMPTYADIFAIGSTATLGIATPTSFTFSGVSLTANTTYWIVLKTSVIDTTGKHPNWVSGTAAGKAIQKSSDPTVSWTGVASGTGNWFKTWH